jgi:hypothetical protein
MSLKNSWRIVRNTSPVFSRYFLELQKKENEEAAAEKTGAPDRGRTDKTEANPPTR